MTVEVATTLPLNNAISESEWSLVDEPGRFDPKFGYRSTQIVRYNVARWKAKLRFESLGQSDRHLLSRFCAAVGRHRSFWMWEPSHNIRGSFPTSELLTTPELASYWTAGTVRSITSESFGVRSTRTDATVNSGIGRPLTVTANATYALRGVCETGAGSGNTAGLSAGSTAFATDYGSLARATPLGRKSLRCSPTTTTCHVGFLDGITLNANYTQQGSVLWRSMSCVRAFMVDGGSGALTQTGNGIYVKALSPTSTQGVMDAGDMVEIVSAGFTQMVRLTEDLNADSGGLGFMSFEPYLRGAVSANDLIIPYKPMVAMMLTQDPIIPTRSGWYSTVEMECEEAFV